MGVTESGTFCRSSSYYYPSHPQRVRVIPPNTLATVSAVIRHGNCTLPAMLNMQIYSPCESCNNWTIVRPCTAATRTNHLVSCNFLQFTEGCRRLLSGLRFSGTLVWESQRFWRGFSLASLMTTPSRANASILL